MRFELTLGMILTRTIDMIYIECELRMKNEKSKLSNGWLERIWGCSEGRDQSEQKVIHESI